MCNGACHSSQKTLRHDQSYRGLLNPFWANHILNLFPRDFLPSGTLNACLPAFGPCGQASWEEKCWVGRGRLKQCSASLFLPHFSRSSSSYLETGLWDNMQRICVKCLILHLWVKYMRTSVQNEKKYGHLDVWFGCSWLHRDPSWELDSHWPVLRSILILKPLLSIFAIFILMVFKIQEEPY